MPSKKSKETLSIDEATGLINEQAFERLDPTVIAFCLTQLIRHLRLKTRAKEHII